MTIDKKIYDNVTNLTGTSYHEFVLKENVFVKDEDVEVMIEDLIGEIDKLQEKYDDLEQDMHDNYKPISHSEMYGISDCDFI